MSSWFYHMSPKATSLHWVEEVTNIERRYERISLWWWTNRMDWMTQSIRVNKCKVLPRIIWSNRVYQIIRLEYGLQPESCHSSRGWQARTELCLSQVQLGQTTTLQHSLISRYTKRGIWDTRSIWHYVIRYRADSRKDVIW